MERTKKLRLGVLGAALTFGALVAVPGAADASRPTTGSPAKPVLVEPGDPATISGSATLKNGCASTANRCETYLGIQQKVGKTWTTIDYARISYQTNPWTIETEVGVDAWYRTVVVDYEYVSTPESCGPAHKRIAGVTYDRYACLPNQTMYRKIWTSRALFVDEPEFK